LGSTGADGAGCVGAPCQLCLLEGREHGRTVPFSDMSGRFLGAMHGPDLLYLVCDPWPWG
jgi:hypothetical protein